jgi:DMSO/TMAO reductase YedYZ molybdopterin-dependent catalytic subunit
VALFGRGRGVSEEERARLAPGQHLVRDFPVLHAGSVPYREVPEGWDFRIWGRVDRPLRWTHEELRSQDIARRVCDIHCVTTWTKLDTAWEGVAVDTLLDGVELAGAFASVECDGGYTTNLALEDLTGGKAWIASGYDGAPLAPEHGGPARLLVPHLYLWKSAKWVRRIRITEENEPGFWEQLGYHDRGDPWREQRYQGD